MTTDHARLLELCQTDRQDEASAAAFTDADPVGMLLVGVYDTGSLTRLALLLGAEPTLATEVVLDGIDRNDEGDRITKLAHQALADHGAELPLTQAQVASLFHRLEDEENLVVAADAARVLEWIAKHHRDAALVFARAHVDETAAGDLDELDRIAASLLGASDDAEDHDALLAYGGRCTEAGHHGPHGTIVGHLTTITSSDVTTLARQLGTYIPTNQAPGPDLNRILEQLTIDQIETLARAVPDPITPAWFTAHLLPRLFETHAAAIVDALDQDWWTDISLSWLLTEAPWANHEASLLVRALRVTNRRGEPARVAQVHKLIMQQTQAAPPDHPVKTAMPRLGARTLLAEALRGDLAPAAAELRAAVGHLHPPLRIEEYRSAHWKQKSSAQRMALVIVSVLVDEAVELTDELTSLSPASRTAFLTALAPHLTDETSALFAATFQDDLEALEAIVTGPAGARELLARWEDGHHLPYFRALAATEHADDRLASVPQLVRDYTNGLTAAERHELLSALGVSNDRYQLLVAIIGDKAQHPGPEDSAVEAVLELTGEHLRSDADPDPLTEAAQPLFSAGPAVRKALYAAMASARPTLAVVTLLKERRADEPRAGQAAVGAAITEITTKLVAMADTEDPHAALAAVEMLDQLAPPAALPVARRLARAAPDATGRITAIRILAEHGNRDTDPTLLRSIADGDNADGELKVRREATRALHRIEIGDLAAAHEKLGELAGQDLDTWTDPDHDPQILYGSLGDSVQEGLDRVAQAETDENWNYGIDQLDEIAKVLLYRALETAGQHVEGIAGLVKQAESRDPNWGSVVGSQQLAQRWGWVRHFAAIHEKRVAHILQPGSSKPPPKHERPDFDAAKVAFRDAAGPCLTLIADHTP